MAMKDNFDPKEDDLAVNLLVHENKKLADRTNIFAAAETIFFNAFVGLVTATNGLMGLFLWFPIIISATGIAFSVYWIVQSENQLKNIIAPLRNDVLKRAKSLSKTYLTQLKSANTKYEWLPIGFVVAWSLLLVVYILHVTNAIVV